LTHLGLGIFSLLGANNAYSMFGLNLTIIMFSGIITAVGCGILRDIFVNEIPLVFRKELYVSLSFAGILLFFIMLYLGMSIIFSTTLGIIFITSSRIAAIKYNWNHPTRIFGNTNRLVECISTANLIQLNGISYYRKILNEQMYLNPNLVLPF